MHCSSIYNWLVNEEEGGRDLVGWVLEFINRDCQPN